VPVSGIPPIFTSEALGNERKRGASFFFSYVFQRPPMNYSQMKDERLLAFYENVRRQVAMDAGSRYRFAGDGVRAYADKLREEMERRRMRFTPIDWHSGG
jgi:hypothetical protein